MKQLQQHNYNGIDATIIADSKNEYGNRITSFIVTMPRIVLAEFNTHRALTRNSASSRAIPHKKMVQKCIDTPFIPIAWMKDHSGMQGKEYFTEEDGKVELAGGGFTNTIKQLTSNHLSARDFAVKKARDQSELGLTKQIINRYLEPFMYHTAITTATEWENFYALRAHDAAEIHIAKLADLMLEQANLSQPKLLKAGEWHIPFGENIDQKRLMREVLGVGADRKVHGIENERKAIIDAMIKIATARCARVSYLNFEGKDDYQADIKLHDRLSGMGHWSPFEHCAQAIGKQDVKDGVCPCDVWSGNFRGFTQYRKTFRDENKSDSRLIKNNVMEDSVRLRVEQERNDLVSKIEKLWTFLNSDKVQFIDPQQKALLDTQINSMRVYAQILQMRLDL